MDEERQKQSIWHVNTKDKPGGRLETLSYQTVIRFLAEGKRFDDRFPKELGCCINDEPTKTMDLALTVVHAYLLTHLDELFEDYRFYPVFKALVLKLDFFVGHVERRPLKEAVESIMQIFPPDYMLKLCLKLFGEPTLVMGKPSKIMAMYVAQSVVRVTGEQVPLICEFIEIDVLRRACCKIIDIKVTSSRRPTLNRWSEDVLTALWYMNRREMVQVFAGLTRPFQRIVIEMISTYGRTKHKPFIQNIKQNNLLTVANVQQVNLGLMPITRTEVIQDEETTQSEMPPIQVGVPEPEMWDFDCNIDAARRTILCHFTNRSSSPTTMRLEITKQLSSENKQGQSEVQEDGDQDSSDCHPRSNDCSKTHSELGPCQEGDELRHDLSIPINSTSGVLPEDDKSNANFPSEVSSNLEFASPADIIVPMKFTPWWQAEAAKVKPSALKAGVETQGHDFTSPSNSTSGFLPGDDKTVEDDFLTNVSSSLDSTSKWWYQESAEGEPSIYKGGETSEREPSTLKTSESSLEHEPLMPKADVSAECEPSPPVAGFNETVSVSRLKSIMSIPSKIGLLIKKGRFQSQATVCEEREGEKTSIDYTKEWKKLKDEIDCLNNEIYSCKVEITTVEYEVELFRNKVRLQNMLINSTQQKFTKRFRAVSL